MPAVVCLAGPQTPEKDELLRGLAAELGGRGLKLGLVRQAAGPAGPAPAGPAHAEIEVGPDSLCLRRPGLDRPSLEAMLTRHCEGLDLVLSELHQDQKVYKLEYCPAGAQPTLLEDPNLKAIVCPDDRQGGPARFAPGDLAGLADLVQGLLPRPQQPLLRILVDGKRIPAKEFVQEIVAGTIRALVGTLKGGAGAKRIEIHLY